MAIAKKVLISYIVGGVGIAGGVGGLVYGLTKPAQEIVVPAEEGDKGKVYLHKDTNIFNIDHIFESGSEGVIQGTYVTFGDSEYKLYVTHANSNNDKFNELHIKNDSIHGFNGSSYSLVHE